MTDAADNSVVLAELQVALFRECNNQRLSPWGRPFSCFQILLQISVKTSIDRSGRISKMAAITKNSENNKINFFSRTAGYFWLNFGMEYQWNIGIQNCKK